MRRLTVVLALVAGVGHLAVADGKKAKGEKVEPRKPGGKKMVVERVVAVVNDAIILDSELRARMLPMMSEAEEIADPKERERRLAKIQSQALDDMVNEELIVQAAEAAKIDIDS